MTPRYLRALAALASASCLTSVLPALAAESSGSTDLSTIQANGSPDPIRTGFFAETELGGFLTIGGQNYSNTEAFLGLGVGYDIIPNLSVGIQFQLAPSVQDCYAVDAHGASTCPPGGTAPATFTLMSVQGKVSYRIPIADRLFIPLRGFAGVTLLSPNPQPTSPTDNGSQIEPCFGGATGIEWATPFDHFTLGAEVSGVFVLQINALALAIYPTVKYTF